MRAPRCCRACLWAVARWSCWRRACAASSLACSPACNSSRSCRCRAACAGSRPRVSPHPQHPMQRTAIGCACLLHAALEAALPALQVSKAVLEPDQLCSRVHQLAGVGLLLPPLPAELRCGLLWPLQRGQYAGQGAAWQGRASSRDLLPRQQRPAAAAVASAPAGDLTLLQAALYLISADMGGDCACC